MIDPIANCEIRIEELEEELGYFILKNKELNERVNELEEIEEKYFKIIDKIDNIWRTI